MSAMDGPSRLLVEEVDAVEHRHQPDRGAGRQLEAVLA